MEPDGTPHKITPHRNTRREARELVLRILFQIDVGKQPVEQVIEGALSQSILDGGYRDFAEEVARGTWEHRAEIDSTLQNLTPDWSPDRQPAVDRNILRMTTYEILFRSDTPVAAVINEAIEHARCLAAWRAQAVRRNQTRTEIS
jgi:N utilization substance protein B